MQKLLKIDFNHGTQAFGTEETPFHVTNASVILPSYNKH
jgi:hypothetical protein